MSSKAARKSFRERLREKLEENGDQCDENVVSIAETTLWENATGAVKGRRGAASNILQRYNSFVDNEAMVDRVLLHAQRCVDDGAVVSASPRVRTRSRSKNDDVLGGSARTRSQSKDDQSPGTNIRNDLDADNESPENKKTVPAVRVFYVFLVVAVLWHPLMKCIGDFNSLSDAASDSQQFRWGLFFAVMIGMYLYSNSYKNAP